MTLFDTIRAIEATASRQPSVQMIVPGDIFRLNSCPDARYGVFGWTQGQHSRSPNSPLITYSFTLFYVDRLNEDRSNELEVQSVGIDTLDNILRTLEEDGIEADDGYTFTAFTQRFSDECAGVFAGVRLAVPAGSPCPEIIPVDDRWQRFNVADGKLILSDGGGFYVLKIREYV